MYTFSGGLQNASWHVIGFVTMQEQKTLYSIESSGLTFDRELGLDASSDDSQRKGGARVGRPNLPPVCRLEHLLVCLGGGEACALELRLFCDFWFR